MVKLGNNVAEILTTHNNSTCKLSNFNSTKADTYN